MSDSFVPVYCHTITVMSTEEIAIVKFLSDIKGLVKDLKSTPIYFFQNQYEITVTLECSRVLTPDILVLSSTYIYDIKFTIRFSLKMSCLLSSSFVPSSIPKNGRVVIKYGVCLYDEAVLLF